MIKKTGNRIFLLLLLFTFHIKAFDLGEYVEIDGFATIGASTVFENGQEFKTYTFQRDGVQNGEINFVNNTLLGLQTKISFTDNFTLTAQGLVFNDYDRHFDTKMDWLYLSYVTPYNITLRVGKFRLPLFKSSELTYVGYSRTSVRPELPFYGVGGLSNITGVDLIYSTQWDETDLTFQLAYGKDKQNTKSNFTGYREFKSNNMFLAKVTAEHEIGLLSLTYFNADSDFLNILPNGVVRDDEKVHIDMISAEIETHYDNFTLEAGIGKGMLDRIQPDELLVYGTLYYQMDQWRPYIVYSSKKFERKKQTHPPAPHPPAPPRSQILTLDETIIGIGLRYDFHENSALKVQLDHVKGMKEENQLLITDDGYKNEATVLTITVDMVF